jgi:hypothetical protein
VNDLTPSEIEHICEKLNLASFSVLTQTDQEIIGQGKRLVQLSGADLGSLSGVFTELPVEVTLKAPIAGVGLDIRCTEISPQDIQEAISHLKRLDDRRQIAVDYNDLTPGATHELKSDEMGRRILVRRRYS